MESLHRRITHWIYSVFKSIKLFMKASWISIAIILIIMLLLTQMGQGTTIIIDLLYNPINVFLLMVLTYALSLVLSHYPDYLEKNSGTNESMSVPGEDKGVLRWDKVPEFSCVGIIYYKEDEKKDLEEQKKASIEKEPAPETELTEAQKLIEKEKNEKSTAIIRFNFFKRVQSIFLFWAIVYLLTYTYKIHINPELNLFWFNLIYLGLSIGFYFSVYKLRMIKKYQRNLHFFGIVFFWVSIILAIFCVVFSVKRAFSSFSFSVISNKSK